MMILGMSWDTVIQMNYLFWRDTYRLRITDS